MSLMIRSLVVATLFLGAPAWGAKFKVNSTADPGDGVCDSTCTLRDAIIAANERPGKDEIEFKRILGSSPSTIYLQEGLPIITDRVKMKATIKERRDLPGRPSKRPGIVLDFSSAAAVAGAGGAQFYPNGFTIAGPDASKSTITGFVFSELNGDGHADCLRSDANPDPLSSAANPFPRLGFCGTGVFIFGADDVTVAGNYFHLDADGITPSGTGLAAVEVYDGSDTMIGGRKANDRNVIWAADLRSNELADVVATMVRLWQFGWNEPAFGTPKAMNNNTVRGNYIGLTAEGVSLDPINRGVWLASLSVLDDSEFGSGPVGWGPQCLEGCEMTDNTVRDNLITATGGPSAVAIFGGLEDTVVSGNYSFNTAPDEVFPPPYGRMEVFGTVSDSPTILFSGNPTGVVIANNHLGIDAAGNPSGRTTYGIGIGQGGNILIAENTITGTAFEAIWVAGYPGFAPAESVSILGNSLFDNLWANALFGTTDNIGIGLGFFDGVTANDPLDPDSGANNLQNFPILEFASVDDDEVRIEGHLDSLPETRFLLEFFANRTAFEADVETLAGDGPTSTILAEGEVFLGSVMVRTGNDGIARFDVELDDINDLAQCTISLLDGSIDSATSCITATATRIEGAGGDDNDGDDGDDDDGDDSDDIQFSDTSEFSPAVLVTD